MPQVIFSPAALRDLERLRAFLRPKAPSAAQRAAAKIIKTVQLLSDYPEIGRTTDQADIRELLIDFGNTGYIALYRVDGAEVVILALRHQREAGA